MTNKTNKQLQTIIEAALFASSKPMKIEAIARLFEEEAEAPSKEDILAAIEGITQHYQNRGVVLAEVSSGYRFQVNQKVAPELNTMFEEKPARYTRALLETLALIAYRQPITRAEIEEVRGVVVSSNIIRTLLDHGWVRSVGHRDVPGRPALYATTKEFLDHFGMKSLEELPPLSDIQNLDIPELEEVMPALGDAAKAEADAAMAIEQAMSEVLEETADQSQDASELTEEELDAQGQEEVTQRLEAFSQVAISCQLEEQSTQEPSEDKSAEHVDNPQN